MQKRATENCPICRGLMIVIVVLLAGCASEQSGDIASRSTTDGTVTTIETSVGVYARVEGYVTVPTTGVEHWYELTGPEEAQVVTLINGSDFPADMWHAEFVGGLLDAGYQVLRYDPRDCGRSERLPWPRGFKPGKWTPEDPPPYPLSALAEDLSGLLDVLKIEQTHLVGVSMGGMIAQLMAIDHADRVWSLSLLSTSPSNSFDPDTEPVEEEHMTEIAGNMKSAGVQSAFSFILGNRWMRSLTTAMQLVTGASDGGADFEVILREMEEYGGYNFMSGHGFAIASAPSRVPDLSSVNVPTLILHGTADPWFPFSHAELLHRLIPHSQVVAIEGEGHAMPRNMYNPYIGLVVAHLDGWLPAAESRSAAD